MSLHRPVYSKNTVLCPVSNYRTGLKPDHIPDTDLVPGIFLFYRENADLIFDITGCILENSSVFTVSPGSSLMKNFSFVLFAVLSAALTVNAAHIRTVNGQMYFEVRLRKVTHKGLVFMHRDGIVTLTPDKLNRLDRKKYAGQIYEYNRKNGSSFNEGSNLSFI